MNMDSFLLTWAKASWTSVGLFWMALWAFSLGYVISSLIQVLVTRDRMQKAMGESGVKSVALGTFFGFISSSCSFAALSTTRVLFQKGAGFIPAMAFLLASTNLVIELGIVIAIFLSWHFVLGEYVGGFLLIGFSWVFISFTKPQHLINKVRESLGTESKGHDGGTKKGWFDKVTSLQGWQQIGTKYVMEWQMVWKDVLVGFTVAGIIAAFVPDVFFETLFLGSGSADARNPGFLPVVAQVLIGPVAAFFTFIGSMGNIPLAALLFDRGVSYAGVMAFIFSDLVVLPVLRINAEYYGWKMALYILGVLLTCLVCTSLLLHYGLVFFDLLPDNDIGQTITNREMFTFDYGFILNLIFLALSALFTWLWWKKQKEKNHDHGHEHGHEHDHDDSKTSTIDQVLRLLSVISVLWLAGGLLIKIVIL